jgi:WD40 repeat protein
MTISRTSSEAFEERPLPSPEWLYDAFVSYRRSDGRIFTKWLRGVLESYRLPKSLKAPHKQLRIYVDTAFERPVDFWKDNIEPSLSRSRFLLVVVTESVFLARPDGSPNWVVREIEYFTDLPQGADVVAIILGGEPDGPLPGNLRDRFPRLHVLDMSRFRPGPWAYLTRWKIRDELIPVIGTLHNIPIEDTPRLRQEHERRQRATAWGVAAISMLLVLVLAVFALYAFHQRNVAIKAERNELMEQQIAEKRRLDAERSRDEAERQTVLGAWHSAARQAVLAGHDHTDDDQAALLAVEAQRLYAHTADQPKYLVEEALQLFVNSPAFSHVLATDVDDVRRVDLSPDGNWLAAGGVEKPVRIWNLRQPDSPPRIVAGRETSPSEDQGFAVAFAPDNRHLASSEHGGIRIWGFLSPNTNPQILRNERCGTPWSLRFSVDGSQLATADPNASAVCVWNLRKPNTAPVLIEGRQMDATFSPDGGHLATVAIPSRAIELWDLAQPSHPKITLSEHRVNQVTFSYDGAHLAGAGSDGNVWIWDLRQPDAPAQPLAGNESVDSIAYSRDGNWLASGSEDTNIRIWNLHQPKSPPLVLSGHQEGLWSVSFALNGNRIASSSQDSIRVWDLRPSSAPPLVLSGHKNGVTSVAFAPDSSRLASASDDVNPNRILDNTVRVWDLRKPASVTVLGHRDPKGVYEMEDIDNVSYVAFSPDGKHLASGGSLRSVRLWDLKTPDAPMRILADALGPVSYSPNGNRLATKCASTEDDAVCVWDLTLPKALPLILHGQKGVINSIAFGTDGEHVAASSSDSDSVRIWDLSNPTTPPLVLFSHADFTRSVAFADNGTLLATADDDDAVRVWDLRAPDAPKIVLRGNQKYVQSVVFSRCSDRLAFAGWDGTVRIWDLRQPDVDPIIIFVNRTESQITTSDRYIVSVAFSHDGNRIAFGSWDGNVRVSPLWSDAADYVCTLVWRNLSMDEWRQVFGESMPYHATCPNLPPGLGAPGKGIAPSLPSQLR